MLLRDVRQADINVLLRDVRQADINVLLRDVRQADINVLPREKRGGRRTNRQTIYLNPNATAYVDCCEACLGTMDERGAIIGHRQATVQGSLRLEADVGFATCRRGHRLVIRRVARPLVLHTASA